MAILREPVIGNCGNCKREGVALGSWGLGNERCHACLMYRRRHKGEERPEHLWDATAQNTEMVQLKRRYGALKTNYNKLEERYEELLLKYKKLKAKHHKTKTRLEELRAEQ